MAAVADPPLGRSGEPPPPPSPTHPQLYPTSLNARARFVRALACYLRVLPTQFRFTL